MSFEVPMQLNEMNEKFAKAPPRYIKVEPSAWASSWETRPHSDVVVGIRLLSAYDKRLIIQQAEQNVQERVKSGEIKRAADIEDEYLTHVMYLACAHAMCDPNDATRDHEVLGSIPLENVFNALTETGARYVFDTIQKTEVEVSRRYPEATTDELDALTEHFKSGVFTELPKAARSTVLRHLRFVLDTIEEAIDQ